MKYFVTLVYLKEDGSFDRSTAQYDTFDEAEKGYHQALVTGITHTEYNKAIVFLFDSDGSMKFKRVWERGVVA